MSAESSQYRTWRRLPGRGPLIIGHRGASAHETENTLPAFQRAMADGADGVELDVQRCASGEVVVFHDEDLRRLARRPERIDELSLAALREVRLRPGGAIPTLAEVLEACGPSALVNIEIKTGGLSPSRELVFSVADVVALAGAAGRVLVSSFSPGAMWLWRRYAPAIASGLLIDEPRRFHLPWPLRPDILLPFLQPSAIHPPDALCTTTSVAAWLARGYAVNVWTVDDPRRIEALAAMGVNSVITNDPANARSALTGRR